MRKHCWMLGVFSVLALGCATTAAPPPEETPALEPAVMPAPLDKDPDLWDSASPVCWVSESAPPFFVIHGDQDTLAFVEDARLFVTALRGVSRNPVVYAEVPHAQHAFDIFHSERCANAVDAVARFLEWVRARDGR